MEAGEAQNPITILGEEKKGTKKAITIVAAIIETHLSQKIFSCKKKYPKINEIKGIK